MGTVAPTGRATLPCVPRVLPQPLTTVTPLPSVLPQSHFPSCGGNIPRDGVCLVVFSPFVALLCAKRPGRNSAWPGLDSAFGGMLGFQAGPGMREMQELELWGSIPFP